MAHFAQLEDNVVTKVIVVHNSEVPNEATGVAFLKTLFGEDTVWKQTSYSGSTRGKFAGIGDTYDEDTDTFVSPEQPELPEEEIEEQPE